MKRASVTAFAIAMVMIMAALASAQRDPREAWLASLITAVRPLPNTEGDIRRVCEPAAPLPSGVTCSLTPGGRYPCTLPSGQPGMCPAHGFIVAFDPPMPAPTVVRGLGIRDARIISTDVHMTQWWIAGSRPLEADRRAAETPTLGIWAVRAFVERPTGPMPRERIGPSSAHPVRSATGVTRLSFHLDLEHSHPGVPPRR